MALDVENRDSFERYLSTGMNLFTGAGFSICAKNEDKKALPVGQELAGEMKSYFKISPNNKLSLGELCTLLERKQKRDYLSFLKQRFSVATFDERYNFLLNVNIKSIFSTNIDDLCFKVFGNSTLKKLSDMSIYGPEMDDDTVGYLPLHGCVAHEDLDYIFPQEDIAVAYMADVTKFSIVPLTMQKRPTLFWGYSLNDASVHQALHETTTKNRVLKERWILLKPEDTEDYSDYYRSLGFYIISGTTDELLDYCVERSAKIPPKPFPSGSLSGELSRHTVQMNKKQEKFTRPVLDFFSGASPTWGDIGSGKIPQTHYFGNVLNKINAGKNVMLTGIPMSGKSTLLKQVANSLQETRMVLFFDYCSPGVAQRIVAEKSPRSEIVIVVDNFTDSMEACSIFLKCPGCQLVVADREYDIEATSYHTREWNITRVAITELSDDDMNAIFRKIPCSVRIAEMKIPCVEKETKPSIYEFLSENSTAEKIHARFIEMLRKMSHKDKETYHLLILACYVSYCRTPLSLDMVIAFLRRTCATEECGDFVDRLNGFVLNSEEDWYTLRSAYVSRKILESISPNDFAIVLQQFFQEVSPYLICHYHIFKRRAFDKDIIKKAFPIFSAGYDFYNSIFEQTHSPFVLQQGALYCSALGHHQEAFAWIDEAISMQRYSSLSMKNSHAIILFKANINQPNSSNSQHQLIRSMEMLKECYKSDCRKLFHVVVFSEQACEFYDRYPRCQESENFLKLARGWIQSEFCVDNQRRDLKRCWREINRRIEY